MQLFFVSHCKKAAIYFYSYRLVNLAVSKMKIGSHKAAPSSKQPVIFKKFYGGGMIFDDIQPLLSDFIVLAQP